MGRLRVSVLRMVVVALYVLTSSLLGFAHQPASLSLAKNLPAEFMLPDGSYPDICGPDMDTGGGSKALIVCDACIITAGSMLPAAPPAVAMPCRFVPILFQSAGAAPPPAAAVARPRSRGPPSHA